MSDLRFRIGDTVQLKSGGPVMTVQAADYHDEIICTWFDRKNRREFSPFHQDTLAPCDVGPGL